MRVALMRVEDAAVSGDGLFGPVVPDVEVAAIRAVRVLSEVRARLARPFDERDIELDPHMDSDDDPCFDVLLGRARLGWMWMNPCGGWEYTPASSPLLLFPDDTRCCADPISVLLPVGPNRRPDVPPHVALREMLSDEVLEQARRDSARHALGRLERRIRLGGEHCLLIDWFAGGTEWWSGHRAGTIAALRENAPLARHAPAAPRDGCPLCPVSGAAAA